MWKLHSFNYVWYVHNLPLAFQSIHANKFAPYPYHMFKQRVPYATRCPWRRGSPKMAYCSVTHISSQGLQITVRQMDPDSTGPGFERWNKMKRVLIIQCFLWFCSLTVFQPPFCLPQLFEKTPVRLSLPHSFSISLTTCSPDLCETRGPEVTLWPWVLWVVALYTSLFQCK